MSYIIEKYNVAQMTQEMIAEAASLFSKNYGIWGPLAAEKTGIGSLKQGVRVRMSAKRLSEQILPAGADTVYVRVMYVPIQVESQVSSISAPQPQLAGNVFGTRWTYETRKMMWVTQLCVDSGHRSRGIAKALIERLREDERGMGIMSSHAHAILAVLSAYGRPTDDVSLDMTRDHARGIMDTCPVLYVKQAKLHGSLFEPVSDGSVSCVDTQFWVDHKEPLEALEDIRKKGIRWPFGALPDGHEFLVMVKAKMERDRAGNRSSDS